VTSVTVYDSALVRIGVYVDGFNLYYGAGELCGRGTRGWRWLNLEALANDLIGRRNDWVAAGATIERLVYCTARIDKNPSRSYLAGDLAGNPGDGVGGHWWLQLTAADYRRHQLPHPCAGYAKPVPW
jgi:hypothetical protein